MSPHHDQIVQGGLAARELVRLVCEAPHFECEGLAVHTRLQSDGALYCSLFVSTVKLPNDTTLKDLDAHFTLVWGKSGARASVEEREYLATRYTALNDALDKHLKALEQQKHDRGICPIPRGVDRQVLRRICHGHGSAWRLGGHQQPSRHAFRDEECWSQGVGTTGGRPARWVLQTKFPFELQDLVRLLGVWWALLGFGCESSWNSRLRNVLMT